MRARVPVIGTHAKAVLGFPEVVTPVVVVGPVKTLTFNAPRSRGFVRYACELRLVEVMVAGEQRPRRISVERLRP